MIYNPVQYKIVNHFFQSNTISYSEAEDRLNRRLRGLEITAVLNSFSDTRRLHLSIFSKKHNQNYSLSLGTENWTWIDADGAEIPVLMTEKNDGEIYDTTIQIKNFILKSLKIKKIELNQNMMLFQIYFDNDSMLEAKSDQQTDYVSHYQLTLTESQLYQNYNLTTQDMGWIEEITIGEDDEADKVALFSINYFRKEHRNFSSHAIKQARERIAPISFIQARVLYLALTTESYFTFTAWNIRRLSITRTRLDTIPTSELIFITRDECKNQGFTIEEAKNILDATVDSVRQWIKVTKDIDDIAYQEYGNSNVFSNALDWYSENF